MEKLDTPIALTLPINRHESARAPPFTNLRRNSPLAKTSSICRHVSCWFHDRSVAREPSGFNGNSGEVSFATSRTGQWTR